MGYLKSDSCPRFLLKLCVPVSIFEPETPLSSAGITFYLFGYFDACIYRVSPLTISCTPAFPLGRVISI